MNSRLIPLLLIVALPWMPGCSSLSGLEQVSLTLAVAAEKFLAKHLGGRFQDDVPEPVAARLELITVDVSQVGTVTTGG